MRIFVSSPVAVVALYPNVGQPFNTGNTVVITFNCMSGESGIFY